MAAVDWGNFPAYIGALLTGGGVVVAAWSLRRAVLDARSQAARKVWPMPPTKEMLGPDDLENGHPIIPWAVVYNGSEEPVFECVLHVMRWDWRTNAHPILASPIFPCIHPNGVSAPYPIVGIEERPREPGGDYLIPLQIEFTDGRGQRWCRRPDARLKPMRRRRVPGSTRAQAP